MLRRGQRLAKDTSARMMHSRAQVGQQVVGDIVTPTCGRAPNQHGKGQPQSPVTYGSLPHFVACVAGFVLSMMVLSLV
jgi:hypothetical protein